MSLANCFKVKGPFKKGFDLQGQLEPGRGLRGDCFLGLFQMKILATGQRWRPHSTVGVSMPLDCSL